MISTLQRFKHRSRRDIRLFTKIRKIPFLPMVLRPYEAATNKDKPHQPKQGVYQVMYSSNHNSLKKYYIKILISPIQSRMEASPKNQKSSW